MNAACPDFKDISFEEYKEANKESQTDKNDKFNVLYTSDLAKQDGFIQSAKAKGYEPSYCSNNPAK